MSNVSDVSVGLAHEFCITAIKAGFTPDDISALAQNEDKMRKVRQFWQNGCNLIIKGPATLIVDRTKPFDTVAFIGAGWNVIEEEKAALKLTEVDFSKVCFENGLKEDESSVTGEDKLKRLKRLSGIRLDAKYGQALYEEKGQATLRFLHDTFGLTWMEFAGTVLRNSGGDRFFLCLYRKDDGSWGWDFGWLGLDRHRGYVSPLLAS